jgi:hypothetical protein
MKYWAQSADYQKLMIKDPSVIQKFRDSVIKCHNFIRKVKGHSAVSQRDARRAYVLTLFFYMIFTNPK